MLRPMFTTLTLRGGGGGGVEIKHHGRDGKYWMIGLKRQHSLLDQNLIRQKKKDREAEKDISARGKERNAKNTGKEGVQSSGLWSLKKINKKNVWGGVEIERGSGPKYYWKV